MSRSSQSQVYGSTRLDPIVKPMLVKLLREQPDDPIQAMIDYLTDLKASQNQEDRNNEENMSIQISKNDNDTSGQGNNNDNNNNDSSNNNSNGSNGGGGGHHALPVLAVTDASSNSPSPLPRSRQIRRQGVSAEPMAPGKNDSELPPRVIPKSVEDCNSIRNAVQGNFLFSTLSESHMQLVLDSMQKVTFNKGQTIIKQGEDGNAFYVLANGECDCFVGDRRVKVYRSGESFGELALMYNVPRAATIKVTTDQAIVWEVDRSTFRRVLMNATASKRSVYEEFLGGIPLLSELDKYEKASLADALVEATFTKGQDIITQGHHDDRFYMLEEGECVAVKTLDGVQTEVMSYKRGGYFGELALLTSQPRAATVKCVSSSCKVVSLDRASFTRLLGPCEEILKRNSELYKQVEQRISLGQGKRTGSE